MRGDLLLGHVQLSIAVAVGEDEIRQALIEIAGVNLLKLVHQPKHQGRQGIDRQLAHRRFAVEQLAISGPGNQRHLRVWIRLHPGRVAQIVEQAVQRQHTGLAGVDVIQGRLDALRGVGEHAQSPLRDQVGAGHLLALVHHRRRLGKVAIAHCLAQQLAAIRGKRQQAVE